MSLNSENLDLQSFWKSFDELSKLELYEVLSFRQSIFVVEQKSWYQDADCLLYTSPSPRDVEESRMPSSA